MSLAAAAGAAARSVRDILAEREEKRLQAALEARQREQMDLQKRSFDAQQEQATESRRAANAQVTASLLGPGRELNAEQETALRGTPYAALLEEQTELPSRTIAAAGGADMSSPGGRRIVTLRPTQEQARDAGQRADLARFTEDPNLPAPTRRYLKARQLGVPAQSPDSFESTGEREAREGRDRATGLADFRQRANIQAGVQDAVARRRATEVTPRDRVQARRWAQQDAADVYESMKDSFGLVPDGSPTLREIATELETQYMDELEPTSSSRTQTRRVLGSLSRVVQAPTRTGSSPRRLVGDLVPVGSGRTPDARPARTGGGGDAYEQYLVRTGGGR